MYYMYTTVDMLLFCVFLCVCISCYFEGGEVILMNGTKAIRCNVKNKLPFGETRKAGSKTSEAN